MATSTRKRENLRILYISLLPRQDLEREPVLRIRDFLSQLSPVIAFFRDPPVAQLDEKELLDGVEHADLIVVVAPSRNGPATRMLARGLHSAHSIPLKFAVPICYIEVDSRREQAPYSFTCLPDRENFNLRSYLRAFALPLQQEGVDFSTIRYLLLQLYEGVRTSGTIRFSLRIMEEPLAASHLALCLLVLDSLYTRLWLVQQGRFADLADYAQTQDSRYSQEAGLVIEHMAHNSPALLDLLVSAGSIAGTVTLALALKTAIDAVALAPLRFRAAKIQNERAALELKIREKEADQQLAEQKRFSRREGAHRAENSLLPSTQAEFDREKAVLALTKQQLDVDRQQLGLDRERLDIERDRVKFAGEITITLIKQVQPTLDQSLQEIALRLLLPPLVQLTTMQDLEAPSPALPEQKNDDPGKGRFSDTSGETKPPK